MTRIIHPLRWLPLLLILVALLVACGTTIGASGEPDSDATIVHVGASDFRYAVDRPLVEAGKIALVLQNDGPTAHDLRITGNGVDQKMAVIARNKTATLTVTLPPGTYALTCTVPAHEGLGMKTTLTVH